ncbi:TonB-dependent receptor [Undibacterium luofuense]|uniref:TonB-dependent receptor n=1 Tax=Undibacterium luofuense TaxID=2828733 RepID=A0A941I619_9BURK|nr:TonB-dependent receptor [Undibacterium luofuense]MBR7782216.1 TonB-dependent receptor [Undibacterium luofuense]
MRLSLSLTAAAAAVLSAFTCSPVFAEEASSVIISANPLGKSEEMQVLTPAKILTGNELRNKLSTSLGDTLSGELGVSASGFGAAASRPVIRGLEGPRIKILQNGMGVADVSSLSNDHAVATESATAQQIEVLRGPASLLYGSGAIGGLVNVVDKRIPTEVTGKTSGEAELRAGSGNDEKSGSFSLDGSAQQWAWHLEGNKRRTGDYAIPGFARQNDAGSQNGRLASSFTRAQNLSAGASYIGNWGYAGMSFENLQQTYGIPTDERSFIDLRQNRTDFDSLIKKPFSGFEDLSLKLSHTDYQHTENQQDGTPDTRFKNKTTEARLSMKHLAIAGWQGSIGLQAQRENFSALAVATGRSDTIPATSSDAYALFAVEEKQMGDWLHSVGARIENVSRNPEQQSALPARSFRLWSASAGSLWQFTPGYAAGVSFSLAQRAPATEELYSQGPHESTATFDIGDNGLKKEESRNLELSLQKNTGLHRWKINAFYNAVNNYVYGQTDGSRVDEEGNAAADGEFLMRHWKQAKAHLYGVEGEWIYNHSGEGWSGRVFGDLSRGYLDNAGNLPLQPAVRTGFDIGYRQGVWRTTLRTLHAMKQDRLASFENFVTPSYTKMDLDITWTQSLPAAQLTWFLTAKNILNQDIRLSTSILRETVPQQGRHLAAGVRVSF